MDIGASIFFTEYSISPTAKLVASLDQVSGGRFVFGIGGGWNAEEMENHGTVYQTRPRPDQARRRALLSGSCRAG